MFDRYTETYQDTQGIHNETWKANKTMTGILTHKNTYPVSTTCCFEIHLIPGQRSPSEVTLQDSPFWGTWSVADGKSVSANWHMTCHLQVKFPGLFH